MGTYTNNYNLFMPSIGEQGWGDLVNGNFITIDTTMKGLDTRTGTAETNVTSLTTRMGTAETTINSNKSRIGTLETETDAMKEKLDKIDVDVNGNLNADTAKELNRVVNVSPSDITVEGYTRGDFVVLLPYVPGVLYSGTVYVQPENTNTTIVYTLSENNVWSSMLINPIPADKIISISRVKAFYIKSGTNSYTVFKLPNFS